MALIDDIESYCGPPFPAGTAKYFGKGICVAPLETREEFNFTFPKGKGTDLWFSFVSHLENKGYKVQKVNEMLEISPVDQSYYALTQRQKEEMEGRIKQGLASVASAVSDYELLAHDVRKYKELLKIIKTNDEHSLRAMFIDEVDISTGPNAIKSIVVRWPTIIADFMTLGEKMPAEENVDKIKDELKISRAEAVILSTKQRLYNNWKEIFIPEVENRFRRLVAQMNSRKKSIEEYKSWLKPLIARHRLYKEGLSASNIIKETLTTPYHSPAQAISTNTTSIVAWQPFVGVEPRAGSLSINDLIKSGINPYDKFTKEKLIFNREKGLAKEHPWIMNNIEFVEEKIREITNPKNEWMKENRLYYVFLQITCDRVVMKSPSGFELEDITFHTKNWLVSQNVLLVLLLELKIMQEEFNREINQLLGITNEDEIKSEEEIDKIIEGWKKESKKEKPNKFKELKEKFLNIKTRFSKIFESLGLDTAFSRLGPYEHNFNDRFTNMYLPPLAVDFYRPHVVSYLLKEAGVGK